MRLNSPKLKFSEVREKVQLYQSDVTAVLSSASPLFTNFLFLSTLGLSKNKRPVLLIKKSVGVQVEIKLPLVFDSV